jgi:hypothetical protein
VVAAADTRGPVLSTSQCAQRLDEKRTKQLLRICFSSWRQAHKAVSFRNATLLHFSFQMLRRNRIRRDRRDSREKYAALRPDPHRTPPPHPRPHLHSNARGGGGRWAMAHFSPSPTGAGAEGGASLSGSMVSGLTCGGEDSFALDDSMHMPSSPGAVSASLSLHQHQRGEGGGGAERRGVESGGRDQVRRPQEDVSTPRASVLHRHRVPAQPYRHSARGVCMSLLSPQNIDMHLNRISLLYVRVHVCCRVRSPLSRPAPSAPCEQWQQQRQWQRRIQLQPLPSLSLEGAEPGGTERLLAHSELSVV